MVCIHGYAYFHYKLTDNFILNLIPIHSELGDDRCPFITECNVQVQIVADCIKSTRLLYITIYMYIYPLFFFLAMTQPLTYENVSHLGLSL